MRWLRLLRLLHQLRWLRWLRLLRHLRSIYCSFGFWGPILPIVLRIGALAALAALAARSCTSCAGCAGCACCVTCVQYIVHWAFILPIVLRIGALDALAALAARSCTSCAQLRFRQRSCVSANAAKQTVTPPGVAIMWSDWIWGLFEKTKRSNTCICLRFFWGREPSLCRSTMIWNFGTENWNPVKILFVVRRILKIQSGHKFAHATTIQPTESSVKYDGSML